MSRIVKSATYEARNVVLGPFYENDELRFISSMIVISIMGAMLEHSRSKALNSLIVLANRLQKVSQTDELTGLPNRRALREILDDEVARSYRIKGDFSIVLCDIDHFKSINDRYGHAIGDEALRYIAATMESALRKSDISARWGGEEFMLALSGAAIDAGIMIAERLRARVENEQLVASSGDTITLTISCGVANWLDHQDLDHLFRLADDRLYRAKAEGRNRVVATGEPG